MRIKKNPMDENYPIVFDDTWGGEACLLWTYVIDDDEWKKFIAELNKVRNEIKETYKKQYAEYGLMI